MKERTTAHSQKETICCFSENTQNKCEDSASREGGEGQCPQHLNIWSGTWNVDGKRPNEAIEKWVFSESSVETSNDFYVISLQEFVSLNPATILLSYGVESQFQYWKQLLEELFESHYPSAYKCMVCDHFGGLCTFVFVKQSLLSFIHHLSIFKVPTEYLDLSNKGALLISFYFSSTSILLCNQHAKAHPHNLQKRIQDYHYLSSISLDQKKRVKDYDVVLWMGDLNSHILLTEQQYKQYPLFMDYSYAHLTHLFLHDPLFSSLFQYDEIRMKQQSDHYFDDFEELSPSFLPTFKLKPGTLCYDLYKKNQHYRPPGWCDRVLYYASSSAKCHIHSTTSCPTVFVSDHLPVVSHSTITLSSSSSLPSLSSPSLLDSILQTLHPAHVPTHYVYRTRNYILFGFFLSLLCYSTIRFISYYFCVLFNKQQRESSLYCTCAKRYFLYAFNTKQCLPSSKP